VVIGADVAEVRGVFAEWQSSAAVAVAVVCELWEDDVQAVVLWCIVEGRSELVQWECSTKCVDFVRG
jgi:hypothetical protein